LRHRIQRRKQLSAIEQRCGFKTRSRNHLSILNQCNPGSQVLAQRLCQRVIHAITNHHHPNRHCPKRESPRVYRKHLRTIAPDIFGFPTSQGCGNGRIVGQIPTLRFRMQRICNQVTFPIRDQKEITAQGSAQIGKDSQDRR
jgi:hypothetical protein